MSYYKGMWRLEASLWRCFHTNWTSAGHVQLLLSEHLRGEKFFLCRDSDLRLDRSAVSNVAALR